jgi:hypothetical protein
LSKKAIPVFTIVVDQIVYEAVNTSNKGIASLSLTDEDDSVSFYLFPKKKRRGELKLFTAMALAV